MCFMGTAKGRSSRYRHSRPRHRRTDCLAVYACIILRVTVSSHRVSTRTTIVYYYCHDYSKLCFYAVIIQRYPVQNPSENRLLSKIKWCRSTQNYTSKLNIL